MTLELHMKELQRTNSFTDLGDCAINRAFADSVTPYRRPRIASSFNIDAGGFVAFRCEPSSHASGP